METCRCHAIHHLPRISIHSTTRVETNLQPGSYQLSQNFNPLHHEGGDIQQGYSNGGVDNFNPLHHEGGDFSTSRLFTLCARTISIHSTTRVETIFFFNLFINILFQSTPPRGWRHAAPLISNVRPKFQSTPPRGWRP